MKKLIIAIAATLTALGAAAQGMPMQPIPEDQAVRKGRLENGMAYYLRHNEKPKQQADFYILHDVGAIQEEDSQQGLAHFLEHMAFNGTKNLPGKQLIEYLETVGVKFGANLNAGTTWDYTCYNISDVPTTRQGIIDSALLILHDWSHFIALEPKEIDAERGVIMEELRTRDGASWRSTIKMLQALGKGSRYAERNLIGYLDGLKGFQHDALETFYKKWYRPDLQAVVIVGDIDVDRIEAQLKELMSDIPAPGADAARKETIVVPDNEEPIVSIFTDPEMTSTIARIFIKRAALPKEMANTVQAEMISIMASYMDIMANARLQEIAMQPDAPFTGAGTSFEGAIGIIPTLDATAFTVRTEDGKLARGLEALLTEMEKIRRFGFTQGEFERAQNDLLRSCEQQYANRNDQTNAWYVNRYLSAYRKNAPMPDAETEWQMDSMLVKSLNVEAINAVAKQLLTKENQVIIVDAPEKAGAPVPTEAEMLAIRNKVYGAELTAYEDDAVKEPLIADLAALKGSPVKSTKIDEVYGTTEWTLRNGVRIVVKPTTFKADEVRFQAIARGGVSLLTDEETIYADLLPAFCQMQGVGKFSATELQKQLSGITAAIRPGVTEYASTMNGNCSPKDIEEMLQLLYLNFTQPRFNENDYQTVMKIITAQVENLEKNPDYLMQKNFTEIAYGSNPRRQELSKELLSKYRFEDLAPVYAKLFPNANSFTFKFVGNVDLAVLKPLVEKYIGSLPVSKHATEAVDDKCDPVGGTVDETFRTPMQQPKVSVRYLYAGEIPYTMKNRIAMTFLTQALYARYHESIREEKGGTYGVQTWGSLEYLPKATYRMNIAFDTNEEMADELCGIILKEIEEIAQNGPKAEDIEKTREYLLKDFKNSLEQNGSWMQYLNAKYGSGLDYLADYEREVRGMSYADIQNLAKQILSKKECIKVMMRPETAAKAE